MLATAPLKILSAFLQKIICMMVTEHKSQVLYNELFSEAQPVFELLVQPSSFEKTRVVQTEVQIIFYPASPFKEYLVVNIKGFSVQRVSCNLETSFMNHKNVISKLPQRYNTLIQFPRTNQNLMIYSSHLKKGFLSWRKPYDYNFKLLVLYVFG